MGYFMKKIGIVTIFDIVGNYGNKLQNYAVVHIFQERGFEVETIALLKGKLNFLKIGACLVNRIMKYPYPNRQLHWLKSLGTREFEKKYLHPNFNMLNGKNISKDYDYFALGSDQVWNPNWYTDLHKEAFLLTFARPEQKICLAPSFGISELPEEWKPWFKEQLTTFPEISVREEDGAKIVKELTGKDAVVLIDPTLMLDAEEWREIAVKPKRVDFDKPYILTYFLGGQADKVKVDIKKYCKEYNLVEYNLQELNGHYPYASDPCEFVYMIEHATLVMTDSFHACVFSFLFQKPFQVYARAGNESSMMSRIETLLEKFDLQRKYVNSGLPNELFESDYQIGFEQLELERKKFEEFLNRQLL